MAATPEAKLVVLDVELSGDLGGPELASEQQARLNLASTKLREKLSATGLYQVVENTSAQSAIDEAKSHYLYLHDCNGCDLDIGRQLGADLVLVAWVNRVSALILSLTYEIHDVATGQIVARKSFGFRGDNDTSWIRAIDYMVRDLESAHGARGGTGDRPDVGEHAASVPSWEGSYEQRGTVESYAVIAGGLRPGELASVPFDEGFGFRSDVKVFIESGIRLADLGVSKFDDQPIPLAARAAGEVKADDDASIREPVPAQRIAHGPQGHERVEILGSDFEPTGTPLAERHADREEAVTR